MKIGMLVDRYKPYISGVTNCVALSKQHLEALGHEVYVFTFGDEDYLDTEARVLRSKGLPLMDTGFHINLNHSQEARKLITQMDVVHVHHPFLSGSLALRYCRPRYIPILFTNHTRYDLYAQAYLPLLPEMISETAIRAFLSAFCRSIDLVVAPSAGIARVLRNFGVSAPIEVIPNGVELEPYQTKPTPFARETLGIGENEVVLIYVGRMGPEKNLPFLLRSFAGIAQAYPQVHLMMVGDGPELENLIDRARLAGLSERVHFTGKVDYAKIPQYLAMADLFVTASVTEVHPLTVIEAMASGLAVVGIDSPGVGDLVVDGVTGCLATNDLAAYTARLSWMIQAGAERLKMGQAAQQESQKYAIQKTVQIYLQQYQKLAADAAPKKKRIRSRLVKFFDRWA